MKANGRRRWRKWAKKGLDIVTGFTSRRLNNRRYWNRWRRHRNAVEVTGPLPPMPPAKPFSPRSLPGMSMGARKRAALAAVADRAILANPPTSYLYKLARQRYLIGQSLRPCPWGCRGTNERCPGNFANFLGPACDGSGLLPSRCARRNT